jgi:hypothetical protein
MKELNRVFEFTLEQLYNANGIEGMSTLCQHAYENEDGEFSGILTDLSFSVIGVREGMVQVQCVADIFEYREATE